MPQFYATTSEPYSLIERENGGILIATISGVKELVSAKVENYQLPGATMHGANASAVDDVPSGIVRPFSCEQRGSSPLGKSRPLSSVV